MPKINEKQTFFGLSAFFYNLIDTDISILIYR